MRLNQCPPIGGQFMQGRGFSTARRRHAGGTLAPALQVQVWRTGGMSPSGMIKPPGWGITGWKSRTAIFRALDYF